MDGNRLRDETVARLRSEIEARGSPPVCLATVLVGADKPTQIYVRMKHKKAEEAGMLSKGVELPETATQAEVEDAVDDARRRSVGARHPRASCRCPPHLDAEAGARPGADREGRRRADRALDGPPRARPARARAAARRSA